MIMLPASNRMVEKTDNSASPAIDAAKDATTGLNAFLTDAPKIDAANAKEGGAWVERVRIALAELEDERKSKADPLYARWKAVGEPYSRVAKPLERLFGELKRRVSEHFNAVEAARRAEAERLRAEAEAKERAAREAEAREADAIAAVDVGVCEDYGDAIEKADEAFADYRVADRDAARAERDVTARITSIVGGRPVSMRTKRVLVVDDPVAAVKAMWPNERIEDAIRKAAKDFEDAFGELPAGVTATHERGL
jgi:hypothetical protein